jgi:lambda family phage tail tape measure protein
VIQLSLAAGQNPLTVLLQQGDQIRGLIAQSGLEGAKLSDVMRSAFTSTIASIKDTAIAMGSVLGGAILSTGKAFSSLVTGPIEAFKTSMDFSKIQGLSTGGSLLAALSNGVRTLGASLLVLSAVPIIAIVSALAMAGTAFYQVYQQEQEMSKQTILNGAAMGLTKDSAIALAKSMNEVGVSTYKGMEVLTAMIGTGNLVQEDFKLITSSVIALEKAGGPAIDETVKMFSKLREKPVEALIDLARTSGLVAPQILAEVNKLATTGNIADAIALAMKTANDVIKRQADQMKGELSALGIVIKSIGDIWNGLMNTFREGMYADPATKVLEDKISAIKEKMSSKGGQLFSSQYSEELTSLSKRLMLLKDTNAANADLIASQSEAARIQGLKNSLKERLDKQEDSAMKKKLTMQEYINKALEDEVKIRGKALEPEEVSKVTKVARVTFDKLHEKEGKGAESKYQSELKAAQNAMNAVLNKDDGLLAGTSEFYSRVNFLRNKAKEGDKITAEQEKAYLDAYLNLQPPVIAAIKEEEKAKADLAKAQEKMNSLIGRADFLGAEYYDTLKLLNSLEGKVGIDPEKLKQAKEALEATTPSAKAFASVMADYSKTLEDVKASSNFVASAYSMDFVSTDEVAKLKAKEELLKSSAKIEAEYNKQLEYNKTHMDSTRVDAANAGALEVAQQRKLLAQDVYDREMYLLSESHKMYSDYFNSVQQIGISTGSLIGEEFANFAKTGKSSFEDLTKSFGTMVQSMVADLIKLRIQKQVTGLFDMAINYGVNALMGGATGVAGTTSAMQGGFGETAPVLPFAKGGSFTNSIVDSPTLFKFAKGTGMMGEAGPEAIMPLRRDSSGSLGVVASGAQAQPVSVVVNNYSTEKATTTETVDSRGQRSIAITIGEAVSSELTRSGSSSQQAMRSTYGVSPQLIRR